MVSITDIIASMTSQQRYLPFGGVREDVGNISQTDFGYTGQRNLDEDIGLMDYRARFYSPVLNRFIQPDTIVPGMYNPQMLNRFSYVGNNPINFNDPSGNVPIDCYGTNYCGASNSNLLSTGKRGVAGLGKAGEGIKSNNNTPSYDGTMYFSTSAATIAELNQTKLSTKAENSYSGFGGLQLKPITNNPIAYSIDFLNNGASTASDFSPNPLNYNPINLELNWSEVNEDILIHNITIQNHTSTIVAIDRINFSYSEVFPTNNTIYGDSNNYAGGNGSLTMNIGALITDNNYVITVGLDITGGFPGYQLLIINLHPSNLPEGCFSIPLIQD